MKQINCYQKNKPLTKKWWETNVHKLGLIALQTQIELLTKASEEDQDFVRFPLNEKPMIVSFSLSIVSDERIQELNSQYRGIDKATDVLSFSLHDASPAELIQAILASQNSNCKAPEFDPEFELGDIFISLPRLEAQAAEYNHSIEREAAFLFTHGFLHLLGYDHVNVKQESEMFNLQDRILNMADFSRKIS
ncbi:MAG: rRNA maturation RNase YbeY [Candidatus Caenarcaniphilales bacterium]|nr:rRNA maturation RNase YbeY [Candidatus Caenarcaniphilales bacterium]